MEDHREVKASKAINGESEAMVPFLKWPGGKRWFVQKHLNLLPKQYDRYIEPFLGGAAVFFNLRPANAILSDANSELIATYLAIKDNWKAVLNEMRRHHRNHSSSYYYVVRDSKPKKPHTRAARFLYLNRTCWNGLYRVNQQGRFNVPIGTRTNVVRDSDNFEAVSASLQKATLLAADFEEVIGLTGKGDLLFIDPPYTVKHNSNNFLKYNQDLFSWSDQIRLRDCVVQACARDAQVVMTNANHSSIRQLYRKAFTMLTAKRRSDIAADSNKRNYAQELILINTGN